MKIKRIILTILICLLLLPLNVLAITYGKTGADTNFNGDVNVPSGFNYYINEVAINLGEANTASNIGAQIKIFKQKTGVDLEFRTLKAESNKILVSTTPEGGEIDIGTPAISRSDGATTKTIILKNNPANATGTITSIEIWALSTDLLNCEVATFYETATNEFSTRDHQAIGTVQIGAKRTFVVDLDVQIGDYLGVYFSGAGYIYANTTGGEGFWYLAGDNIPCTTTGFSVTINWLISLYGTGVTSTLDYIRFDVQEGNIKLDDLGTPDDNTDLNASITRHGLLPKLPNVATQFLDGTGVWAALDMGDIPLITPAKGGTGVANNAANTLTYTGAFSLGLTLSANTALTLPTAGTVAVTANKLSAFATTTSAELAGVISNEKTPVNAIASQGTITMAGIATATETFVIDSQTFTWVAARSVAGEVTIGADAPAAVVNIVDAVTTDLATVTAVDGAGDTVTITAVTKGVAGNSIVFTEASTNMTVDGAGTLGTTTAGVDGTVGVANEIAQDATYLYVCIATNTIADTNWRRVTLGSVY